VLSYQKISQTAGDFCETLDAQTKFGMSVVVLEDIDGDGVKDIAVSSVEEAGQQGAVWILFSDNTSAPVGCGATVAATTGGSATTGVDVSLSSTTLSSASDASSAATAEDGALIPLIVGVCAAVVVLIALAVAVFLWRRRSRGGESRFSSEEEMASGENTDDELSLEKARHDTLQKLWASSDAKILSDVSITKSTEQENVYSGRWHGAEVFFFPPREDDRVVMFAFLTLLFCFIPLLKGVGQGIFGLLCSRTGGGTCPRISR
jgi:FG-GAP repeat